MKNLGLGTAVERAEQHTDFPFSLWHLAIVLVFCWGWLFYLFYHVLR
jgi:hypothetical protein